MATLRQAIHYHGAQQAARLLAPAARRWRPYSRVLVARDYAGWTLDVDALLVMDLCRKLNQPASSGAWASVCSPQAIFHVDQFVLLNPPDWGRHRVAIAYYHGMPGTGFPEFDDMFKSLMSLRDRIHCLQVSHVAMRDFLAGEGFPAHKLHLIPIAVHAGWFRPPSSGERERLRRKLGFPEEALVVGSFQKDGTGWGEGNSPKAIKGPDVFIGAVSRLKREFDNLHVLLTGPSRGYVKNELDKIGVPYRHVQLKRYRDIAAMYHALDLYIVSSRQEGGPKAVLESMASGVPLVSTKVGQATDLIRHDENACLADVEDVESIAHSARRILSDPTFADGLRQAGLATAAKNSFDAQLPLWRRLFTELVDAR